MRREEFSKPLALETVKITDAFWKAEMELVRKEVIPYQWDALNDKIPEAAKSYCMRNYKLAGEELKRRKEAGYVKKIYPATKIETLPEGEMDGRFYGFVFQDSDFSKWIEAVAYSLAQYPDAELEKTADEAIDIVCAAQREDGYLDTFYILNDESKIFSNLRDMHELYCFGHLAEGAVAYYEATGKEKLLNAAKRYAEYISKYLGPEADKKQGYPGHEIAEMALMRIYEVSGEQKYLDLAKYFVDERGKQPYYFDLEKEARGDQNKTNQQYHQSHLPVREQNEAVGHSVRAVYLYSGMADVAKATGDEALYHACEQLWDNIEQKKMYITGGIGGTHIGESFSFNYDLPNDTAYAETCASIGLVFFARRMLEIHADSKYADVMETALYNGILSGMALDGKSFFYVNPLEVLPEACARDERKAHVKAIRQKWFGCACCPPNLARTISSISKYAFTEKADTLWIHLYMGAEIRNENCQATITASLPWSGEVSLTVDKDFDTPYTFAFRIPGWCKKYELQQAAEAEQRIEDGYLYLTKKWRKGEQISLNFPMEITAVMSNDAVRENIGKVAVTRGPIVYCMEEADNGKNLHLLKVKLPLEAEFCQMSEMGQSFVGITAKGQKEEHMSGESLYREWRMPECKDVDLKFVPYFMWNNRGEGEMQVWVR